MVMHGHRETRKQIISIKHPVMRLHVEQLNGENVRGALQFLQSKNQGSAMPLPQPPLDGCVKRFDSGGVSLIEDAKKIEVRMLGVKLTCHGGAVQSYGLQIFGSGRFQFLDEFIQLWVHQSMLLLPRASPQLPLAPPPPNDPPPKPPKPPPPPPPPPKPPPPHEPPP